MTRIIAGSYGGRTLATPRGDKTRPTSERVREALFSALAVWADRGAEMDVALEGLAFLDLYAGSGAIGLEAASRGATPVTLVEKDRAVANLIKSNARTLGAVVDVVAQAAEAFVASTAPRGYDVVWADPPYAVTSEALDRIVADLVANGFLAPDGLLILERSSRAQAPALPARFAPVTRRRYGETSLYFAELETA